MAAFSFDPSIDMHEPQSVRHLLLPMRSRSQAQTERVETLCLGATSCLSSCPELLPHKVHAVLDLLDVNSD
jgi:hypothetical protein